MADMLCRACGDDESRVHVVDVAHVLCFRGSVHLIVLDDAQARDKEPIQRYRIDRCRATVTASRRVLGRPPTGMPCWWLPSVWFVAFTLLWAPHR